MKTSAVNLYCQWPLDNKIKFWDQCLDTSSRCNDQWCFDWQEDTWHTKYDQSEASAGSCWPMRGGMSRARDMLWRVTSLTCCVSRSPCWQEFHVASLTNRASVLFFLLRFLFVFMISSSYKSDPLTVMLSSCRRDDRFILLIFWAEAFQQSL